MINKTLTIVSAALCVAIGGYAISSQAGSGPARPETEKDLNARVLKSLNLSSKQEADYGKLCVWFKAETIKMKQQGPGAMSYGLSLNEKWREGMKKIFTRAQWDKYCTDTGFTDLIDPKPTVALPDWASKEDRILASLNLTEKQKKDVAELQAQLAIENKKLDDLWNGTDAYAIGRLGSKINKMQNDGMKRILTAEQLHSYLDQWGQFAPPPKPDGKFYSPAKPVLRGDRKP